jgi:hypothetical protein
VRDVFPVGGGTAVVAGAVIGVGGSGVNVCVGICVGVSGVKDGTLVSVGPDG